MEQQGHIKKVNYVACASNVYPKWGILPHVDILTFRHYAGRIIFRLHSGKLIRMTTYANPIPRNACLDFANDYSETV